MILIFSFVLFLSLAGLVAFALNKNILGIIISALVVVFGSLSLLYMIAVKIVSEKIIHYNQEQEEKLKNSSDPSAKIVMLDFNQVKELEKNGAVKDEVSGEIITKGV